MAADPHSLTSSVARAAAYGVAVSILYSWSAIAESAAPTAAKPAVVSSVETLALPVITAQPLDRRVRIGQSASFTIVATGAQFYSWSYRLLGDTQWRGGIEISLDWESPTFTIPKTKLRFNGMSLRCVVANGNGVVTSLETVLTIDTSGYSFTTWAGAAGQSGIANGSASQARFHSPSGLAVDGSGNVYVADTQNAAIRRIAPDGTVSTFAGLPGSPGYADENGTLARFNQPRGVAVDAAGTVYVADYGNDLIRKISPSGNVTTLAGQVGLCGSTDNPGLTASFCGPSGVAVDNAGFVYVADSLNSTIRRITPAGVVVRFAGITGGPGFVDGPALLGARFNLPSAVALDPAGNLYVADTVNRVIRKIVPPGVVSSINLACTLCGPTSVAADASGVLYVADESLSMLFRVSPNGDASVLASAEDAFAPYFPLSGWVDGSSGSARFNAPRGIAVASDGTVYVGDTQNHVIRRATTSAAFDPLLQVSKCAAVVASCDSDILVEGRDGIFNGGEMHQPNTLQGACADGTTGTYRQSPSIERVRVFTVDGSPLVAGKLVRLEARAWTSSFGSRLDFFYAADATNPNWVLLNSSNIAANAPGDFDPAVLSLTYTLPAGSRQAVRIAIRVGGAATPCSEVIFNDEDERDDLVFAVMPAPAGNLIQNASFSNGSTGWNVFEPPDITYSVNGGVFEFYRANPTTTESGQAVVFQHTGIAVPEGSALTAVFDIGNSSSVRKRISVLVLNSDFSDLNVCTFWLPAGAPLRTYQMRTHNTKAWTNAAIYFYAATPGQDGGFYRLTNVSLHYTGAGAVDRTDCVDTWRPSTVGIDSNDLLVNGAFSGGSLVPWQLFGDITPQVVNGVFEFVRPGTPGTPAGVILQPTNTVMLTNSIFTASFQLGNSSSVRKRVTVLLHDLSFSDLTACTFWLRPNQPLATYTMRGFASRIIANLTLSVYLASVGTESWARLDNVSLRYTPGQATVGTDCIEPSAGTFSLSSSVLESDSAGASTLANEVASSKPTAVIDTPSWQADSSIAGRTVVRQLGPVNLRSATRARLSFESQLTANQSVAGIEWSADGLTWLKLADVPPADVRTGVEVDLSGQLGQVIFIRFVFDAGIDAHTGDSWKIEAVSVEIDGVRLSSPLVAMNWVDKIKK